MTACTMLIGIPGRRVAALVARHSAVTEPGEPAAGEILHSLYVPPIALCTTRLYGPQDQDGRSVGRSVTAWSQNGAVLLRRVIYALQGPLRRRADDHPPGPRPPCDALCLSGGCVVREHCGTRLGRARAGLRVISTA